MKLGKARRGFAALAAIMLVALGPSAAEASKHRALLIGNNYPDLPKGGGQLENANADADNVERLLKRLGFGEGDSNAIVVKKDASLADIYELWQKTLDEVDGGGIVVFFFSGHGFQDRNTNYLLQNGAPLPPSSNPKVLESQYVRLDAIMDSFIETHDKKKVVGLFIIDACREDVFKPAGARALGASRGLAPVRVPTESETFILFATAPGQFAYDGLGEGEDGKSSVFTRNLISHYESAQNDQVL